MDVISLLISLVSGAGGGNIAGAAMSDKNLGPLGNSIAGILGVIVSLPKSAMAKT